MATRLAVAVAVTALLFLFTFSSARDPSDQPANDVITEDITLVDLPGSDFKTAATIILPSEKPESEPASFVEIEPEETEVTDSRLSETETGKEKPESQIDSVPLTVVNFHPVNHHFPRRPWIPIRHGHRCHGHRRHHLNQFRKNGQRMVSYGNDMILAKDQNRGFDRVSSYGQGEEVGMWTRYNHGGEFSNDETRSEEMKHVLRRWGLRHRHHHHHHDEEGEEEHEHEHKHKHESRLMKGIRKFLGNF